MPWQNPILLLALMVGAWAVWRVLAWAGSGGRLPLRGRRGSASGFAAASLAVQALYQPSARHVVEMQAEQQDHRDEDGEGEPPSGDPDVDQPS